MLVTWMFLRTSITNRYAIYISPAGECATILGQSKNCSSLQGISASLKSIFDTVFLILQNQNIWPIEIVFFINIVEYKVPSKVIMMMMMNCFCDMVDRRNVFSLISSQDHCQRFSPSRVSATPRAGLEPAQNLSSGLVEWNCALLITTTTRCYYTDNHYTTVSFL